MTHDPPTVTRTRRALAEQLREALDDMQAKGLIDSWSSHYGEPGKAAYTIRRSRQSRPTHTEAAFLTPGDAMAFVNENGYDVQIGKA